MFGRQNKKDLRTHAQAHEFIYYKPITLILRYVCHWISPCSMLFLSSSSSFCFFSSLSRRRKLEEDWEWGGIFLRLKSRGSWMLRIFSEIQKQTNLPLQQVMVMTRLLTGASKRTNDKSKEILSKKLLTWYQERIRKNIVIPQEEIGQINNKKTK